MYGTPRDNELACDALKTQVSSPSRQNKICEETLENGNFPYKVDIVQSKDFAESYREGFEMEKVKF